MLRRVWVALFALVAGSLSAASAHAALELRMDYAVTALGGGQFQYDFALVMDNHNSTWTPGQGWTWIIFGDATFGNTSPLTGFIGNVGSLPSGFTGFTDSSGGHNGPTLSPVVGNHWIPTAVGQRITWSGTSTADLQQGSLLFSTLQNTGGATLANFVVANRVASINPTVPEPASLALWSLGALGCAVWARRRQLA